VQAVSGELVLQEKQMKKVLRIGFKDLRIIFRDRTALIMMLLAPLVLTVAMGFVTGSFSDDDNSGPVQIAVVVTNGDQGLLGQELVEVLQDQGTLLDVIKVNNAALARQRVDEDTAAAAVIVPADFSAGFAPGSPAVELTQIELYANPGRPISASVVEAIVRDFSQQVEMAQVIDQVTAQVISAQVATGSLATLGGQANQGFGPSDPAPTLTIQREQNAAGEDQRFDPLAYFATGMAVFFLMYTVTIGGRSILAERDAGTLARMLSSPTTTTQVLGGKVLGVFLAGLVQVTILIVASSLLFDLRWGTPAGVAALVIAVVAAATGWGILLAASSKSPGQVAGLGTAMMLIFGMLGGTFISTSAFSGVVSWLSRLTPHSWALDGFAELATGRGLADILVPVLALLAMATVLFGLSVFVFRRRWVSII
jgi:ABC-2 type transport system permease protein